MVNDLFSFNKIRILMELYFIKKLNFGGEYMGVSNYSQGLITNYHYDNNTWYTTKESDEVILFKNKDNKKMTVNSIMISTETELLVQLLRTSKGTNTDDVVYETDVVFIPANSSFSTSSALYNGIKVLGILGQKIRWIANFV